MNYKRMISKGIPCSRDCLEKCQNNLFVKYSCWVRLSWWPLLDATTPTKYFTLYKTSTIMSAPVAATFKLVLCGDGGTVSVGGGCDRAAR